MQGRYDLYNKLIQGKKEIEEQVKYISHLQKSAAIQQKLYQIVSEFDRNWKQIPKTLILNAEQKPVALQEYYEKIKKKIENKKSHFMSRYSREIEQINSKCNKLSKQITNKSVEFVDDTRTLESRFKRQFNMRKQRHLDSIDAIKKVMKNNNQNESLKGEYLKTKEREEKRIEEYYQNQIKTINQKINFLQQELTELNESGSATLEKPNLTKDGINALINIKNNEIDIIKKQKEFLQMNIDDVIQRIDYLRQSQVEQKKNFENQLKSVIQNINNQHKQLISSKKEEINNIQDQINKLEKLDPENDGFQSKQLSEEEINAQRQKMILNTNNKLILDYEKQIDLKTDEYKNVIKEIHSLDQNLRSLKEKEKENNSKKLNQIESNNHQEIQALNNELIEMRNQFLENPQIRNSNETVEIMHLQNLLTDIDINTDKIKLENQYILFLKNEVSKILNLKSNTSIDIEEIYDIYDILHQSNFLIFLDSLKVIEKLNGYLSFDKENNIIDTLHSELKNIKCQMIIERMKEADFEKNKEDDLNEKKLLIEQINQDQLNLINIKHNQEIILQIQELFFELLNEIEYPIPPDLYANFNNLKSLQDQEITKFSDIQNKLNEQKLTFSMLNHEVYQELMDELISKFEYFNDSSFENEIENNNFQLKKKHYQETLSQLNDMKNKNENENEENIKIFNFLYKKEFEACFKDILQQRISKHQIQENIIKEQIKSEQLKFQNIEEEEEIIYQLKDEIRELEKQLIQTHDTPHQKHFHIFKTPLPPLRDK